MAHDDVEIDVINQQTALAHNSVNYQPFAVKVLKLRIRRNPATRPDLDPIWIIPKGYQPPDHQSANPKRWRAYGTADDTDLWIAWGAGDERGFAVKTNDLLGVNKKAAPLDDDDFHYVYLHLIHRPADTAKKAPDNISLTVQAVDANHNVHGQTTVNLTAPPDSDNALRPIWQSDWTAGQSKIHFAAPNGGIANIPRYVSRWWPRGQVAYEPIDDTIAPFLDNLNITFQRRVQNGDSGRISVRLGQKDLLRIGGDIAIPLHDYRQCNFELFRFLDDRHVVLRIWLYWVQLRFSTQELLTFVPAADQATRRAAAEEIVDGLDAWWQRGAAGAVRFLPWRIKEEVPDVERVDLLFDMADGRLRIIGTDTHWQEFWAVCRDLDKPIEVNIAPLSDSLAVLRQGNRVPKRQSPPVFNPLANGLCDFVNDSHLHCPHRKGTGQMVPVTKLDPQVNYRICDQCGTHFTGEGVKAVGLGKHAPVLGNVEIFNGKSGNADAISSGVLDG